MVIGGELGDWPTEDLPTGRRSTNELRFRRGAFVFGSEGDRSAGLCQKEHGKYKYIVEVCKSMKNELLQWVQPRVVEGK